MGEGRILTRQDNQLSTMFIVKSMFPVSGQYMSGHKGNVLDMSALILEPRYSRNTYPKSNRRESMVFHNRQRQHSILLSLWCIIQQVLSIKPRPNNNGTLTRLRLLVPLRLHNHPLKFNKLPKSRLLFLVREICPARTGQAHIWDVGLLGCLDQFSCDVEFGSRSWRDKAGGVSTDGLECLDHLAHLSGLVSHDFSALFLKLLAHLGGRVHSQSRDFSNLV
jgi:hypothetical protein